MYARSSGVAATPDSACQLSACSRREPVSRNDGSRSASIQSPAEAARRRSVRRSSRAASIHRWSRGQAVRIASCASSIVGAPVRASRSKESWREAPNVSIAVVIASWSMSSEAISDRGARRRVSSVPSPSATRRRNSCRAASLPSSSSSANSSSARRPSAPDTPPISRYASRKRTRPSRRSKSSVNAYSNNGSAPGSSATSASIAATSPGSSETSTRLAGPEIARSSSSGRERDHAPRRGT